MVLQLHAIFTTFAGPVKVSVVGVWQLLAGTVMTMRSPPPGLSVSLPGLKVMLATPLLDACQLRLWSLELLLIDAMQDQLAPLALYEQSLLA